MDRFLGAFSAPIYAALRFIAGTMLVLHGAQKILGIFGGFGGTEGATAPMFSQLWVGGIIELGGGAMIALGLFTSWAAFVCSGMMAVAYLQFHWLGSGQFWPILNKGEAALLYCFVFLYIASRGTGILGVMSSKNGHSET